MNNESPAALLREVLPLVEFDAKGYCLVCGGWNVSPQGCTPRKHTKDCKLAKLLSSTAPAASESRGSAPDVPRRCRHRDIAAGVHWRCDLADGHEGKHVMVGDDPDAKCMHCGERRGDHDDSTPCVATPTPPAVSNGDPPDWAIAQAFRERDRLPFYQPNNRTKELAAIYKLATELARSAAAKGEG